MYNVNGMLFTNSFLEMEYYLVHSASNCGKQHFCFKNIQTLLS